MIGPFPRVCAHAHLVNFVGPRAPHLLILSVVIWSLFVFRHPCRHAHELTRSVVVSSFCVHGSLSPVSSVHVFRGANISKHTRRLKSIAQKKHFHGSGALRLNAEGPVLRVAMSAEQTHQRLGVAEGATRELQKHMQRVSAGHQAAHEHSQLSIKKRVFSAVKSIRGHV